MLRVGLNCIRRAAGRSIASALGRNTATEPHFSMVREALPARPGWGGSTDHLYRET